jgi:hypothetical protein
VAIPSLCVRIDLRKEEDHFLTIFFFFGHGAIGDREFRKGKAQLIHVANVFRIATKNKKLLVGGIQSESSRSNCDVANLVTTAKKNIM